MAQSNPYTNPSGPDVAGYVGRSALASSSTPDGTSTPDGASTSDVDSGFEVTPPPPHTPAVSQASHPYATPPGPHAGYAGRNAPLYHLQAPDTADEKEHSAVSHARSQSSQAKNTPAWVVTGGNMQRSFFFFIS